jgi:hypothetical protein
LEKRKPTSSLSSVVPGDEPEVLGERRPVDLIGRPPSEYPLGTLHHDALEAEALHRRREVVVADQLGVAEYPHLAAEVTTDRPVVELHLGRELGRVGEGGQSMVEGFAEQLDAAGSDRESRKPPSLGDAASRCC